MRKLTSFLPSCFKVVLAVILLPLTQFSMAGVINLSGVYQGKNIYVQNPFTSNMQDFCTEEVFVNDVKVMTNIKQSAFEIDLSHLNLNDQVNIKITHKDDCKPRVLNAQVIKPNSTFQFTSINIDHEMITWATKGEKQGGKFFIEQFVYNNWNVIMEIPAKGSATLNNYQVDEGHHSGTNKYRVKYQEKEGVFFYSRVVEHSSLKDPVTFYPKRASTTLFLSRDADYEILDASSVLIKKGKGKEIPIEELKSGVYYLNVDNKTEKFMKK